MMVMQPSDSMSSMGSQMIRMDSAAGLSQASSFQNIHEINRDISAAKLKAVGSATQFVRVEEDDNESDDESVMERVADDASEGGSVMRRGDDDDDSSVMRRGGDDETSEMSESVMRRGAGDDATSMSESVMRLGDDEDDSSSGTGGKHSSVPKELRGLGRAQQSTAYISN